MLPEFVLQGLLSAATGVLVAVSTAALSVHRENERWLRDNIHEPLYEELKSVLAGELPRENGGYKSMWAKLNYYKTYRVSRDLKRGLVDVGVVDHALVSEVLLVAVQRVGGPPVGQLAGGLLVPDLADHHHVRVLAQNGAQAGGEGEPHLGVHLDLTDAEGQFQIRWFNPFEGGRLQEGSVETIQGGKQQSLGTPPARLNEDWVVLVEKME